MILYMDYSKVYIADYNVYMAYCKVATSVVTERGDRVMSLSLLTISPGSKSSSAVVT